MSDLSASCKGCYFNLDCIIKSAVSYYNISYICKCKSCLIKGICEDNCEEIDNILHEIDLLEERKLGD